MAGFFMQNICIKKHLQDEPVYGYNEKRDKTVVAGICAACDSGGGFP